VRTTGRQADRPLVSYNDVYDESKMHSNTSSHIHKLINKKYVLWNVNLPNDVAFNTQLSTYLTVTVMTLI